MLETCLLLHNKTSNRDNHPHSRKALAVKALWRNLKGPSRALAISSTILLVSSASLGAEAGIMILLGPARDILVKPFILLGYLEVCAMFFSLLFIVASIIGLIFYRPYHYIRERIYLYRASRAPQVSDRYTYFENAGSAPPHNPEEDGTPD
jgi:hypothetical protein